MWWNSDAKSSKAWTETPLPTKTLMKKTNLICASLFLMMSVVMAEESRKPNILVILTDDLGYSDLGCYGSEIDTPNLNRLAAKGLRFSQFYNTAKCHSSRVSLLTGRWCHQAGDIGMKRAVTIPEILRPAGYSTLMCGKWHLQNEPTDFGFDRFFGHLSGSTYYYKGDATFRLNGSAWKVPNSGFYTTVAKVDHALGFLNEARESKKPWFLYMAFNAPHAPLQPLKEDYEKYLGRYDVGWDAIRAQRFEKQQELGLFPRTTQASPRPSSIPAWSEISADRKSWEARRMTALAAMIDRVDQEIGRLLADIEARGELDHTLILFFSDNGACPYDRKSYGMDRKPYEPGANWSDSTAWAWARNSPFRFYKQNQHEGGIATPAIVHWPAGLKTQPGTIVHQAAHLVDVLPTLAEVAGAEIPTTFPGRSPSPLAGISLTPIFDGAPPTSRPPIHLHFNTDRGLRDGDWKIVSFRENPWELYNIAEDRTEIRNLAKTHPEIVSRLAARWHDMATHILQLPEAQRGPVKQKQGPDTHPEWTHFRKPLKPSASGKPTPQGRQESAK
jgi:arylsulfatase A-like enzyme